MDKQQLTGTARVDALRSNNTTGTLYYTRVSPNRRYLWVSVQKAASVTIAIALRQLDGIPLTDGALWDDEEVPKLRDFMTPEIAEMLTSPVWFRFCFVRNPYHRLFSAYKDKIMQTNQEPFYQRVQEEIREMYDYQVRDGQRIGVVAFRDFVRYVQSGARSDDGHWCIQRRRLMPDIIPYNFIGRFETFVSDFASVLDRLDATAEVRATASIFHGQTSKIPLAVAYDRELANTVYEVYREDFETFGYDRDSWMFENE